MRPSSRYQIEEKSKQRKEADDDGGPDDPAAYIRRLRKNVDELHKGTEEKFDESSD